MWLPFPECVARVPVSFGGLGVRLCSRKVVSVFATVRNRPQPSATVCVSAVRLSTVASASGVVPEVCQVDSSSPQLYWCLQRKCLCEESVSPQLYWRLQRKCLREESVSPQLYYIGVCRGSVCVKNLCRRSYIGVCRGSVCVSDLCRRSYIGVCRGSVCVKNLCRRSYIILAFAEEVQWSVSPQLYWRLQRMCLCEPSVSPQFYWCLQRRCLCERCVSPQLYWCLCEWSVSPQLYYIGVCRGSDLCEESVSPQLYWCLQRKCLCEWSVSPQLYRRLQRKWSPCYYKSALCDYKSASEMKWNILNMDTKVFFQTWFWKITPLNNVLFQTWFCSTLDLIWSWSWWMFLFQMKTIANFQTPLC